MIGFNINQAKSMFFDSKAVMAKVPPAERRALSKFGAEVRKVAQKSILTPRDDSSKPGKPPHGHISGTRTRVSKSTGKTRKRGVSLLREYIYFVYEADKHGVIIGPAKLNGTEAGDALESLEYGGQSVAVGREKGRRVKRRVRIAARPFMHPAFDAVVPELDDYWRDAIK